MAAGEGAVPGSFPAAFLSWHFYRTRAALPGPPWLQGPPVTAGITLLPACPCRWELLCELCLLDTQRAESQVVPAKPAPLPVVTGGVARALVPAMGWRDCW